MQIIEEYLVHWPFLSFMLIVWVIAQTLKIQILTPQMASKYKVVFWSRRIFPLILLALGTITGLLWPGEASPGVLETHHKLIYFTSSAAFSIVGFNTFKTWVKKKYDVVIEFEQLTTEEKQDEVD